jgi:hypothetical protein
MTNHELDQVHPHIHDRRSSAFADTSSRGRGVEHSNGIGCQYNCHLLWIASCFITYQHGGQKLCRTIITNGRLRDVASFGFGCGGYTCMLGLRCAK